MPSTMQASSSTSTTTSPESRHNGLRSHLIHLLPPRHVLFHCKLTIHELENVPLVSGEFGVRWRFKNVHARVKANSSKGKGKEPDIGALDDSSGEGDDSSQPPSSLFQTSNNSSARSTTSTGSNGPVHDYGSYVPPAMTITPPRIEVSTPPHSPGSLLTDFQSDHARGMTKYGKLVGHNVKWEHMVDVALSMDVQRDTRDLLPNELKLVIMQHVIQGDPDAPQKPRTGVLYLNLAEYVDVGPVTRKYLLRQNKTNATLKLTLELVHIGGEKTYKKPPLPKGEIMAGISEILSGTLGRRLGLTSDGDSDDGHDYDWELPPIITRAHSNGSFVQEDLERLGLRTGPGRRTTENLIEALFNPVPTSSTTTSPFTYYVPQQPQIDISASARKGTSENDDAERASLDSSGGSSARTKHTRSLSTRSTHSSSHETSGIGHDKAKRTWWRKLSSRPGTPSKRHTKSEQLVNESS